MMQLVRGFWQESALFELTLSHVSSLPRVEKVASRWSERGVRALLCGDAGVVVFLSRPCHDGKTSASLHVVGPLDVGAMNSQKHIRLQISAVSWLGPAEPATRLIYTD